MRPLQIAAKYVGQTEKKMNSGFNDATFEKRMSEVGFQKTHPWCCYFAELVYKEAYPEKFAELDKLFSGSTLATFRNFRDAAYLIGMIPQKDTLVIWQSMREGKGLATGHAAIVVDVVDKETFWSIEGNGSKGGSREGTEVVRKLRKVLPSVANGLKILGFIQISRPINLTLNV